jgi:hypothetical protein
MTGDEREQRRGDDHDHVAKAVRGSPRLGQANAHGRAARPVLVAAAVGGERARDRRMQLLTTAATPPNIADLSRCGCLGGGGNAAPDAIARRDGGRAQPARTRSGCGEIGLCDCDSALWDCDNALADRLCGERSLSRGRIPFASNSRSLTCPIWTRSPS